MNYCSGAWFYKLYLLVCVCVSLTMNPTINPPLIIEKPGLILSLELRTLNPIKHVENSISPGRTKLINKVLL